MEPVSQPPLQIDPQELQQRLAAGDKPLLLDVRAPQELLVEGAIAGVVNIPLDQLPARVQELPAGAEIVAVCKSGMRSANAAQWLRGTGRSARSLLGGMNQWKLLGLPLAK